MPGHELARAGPDQVEDLAGLEAGGGAGGDAGGDAALEAGDPDHEELVEVRGEDREEVRPFEEGGRGVLGEFEDALVEREPAALPVEEPPLRQFVAERAVALVRVGIGVQAGVEVGGRLRTVRGYGTEGGGGGGGRGGLDRDLGGLLAHDPILPRERLLRRVGAGRGGGKPPFGETGHGALHCVSVASASEWPVTTTCRTGIGGGAVCGPRAPFLLTEGYGCRARRRRKAA